MGRIFLEHINGVKLYACAACETNLTNKAELISTRFTGATGERSFSSFQKCLCFYPFSPSRTCLPLQTRCQSHLQWRPGSGDAHGTPHGAGCDVQELQGETRLDVRVRNRRVAEVQGGTGDPGIRTDNRIRWLHGPVRGQCHVPGQGPSLAIVLSGSTRGLRLYLL